MSWTWRYEADGGETPGAEQAPAPGTFPNQGDAESWLGENWRELLHAGVTAVTLLDSGREVYGPMSLSAAE